MQKLITRKQIRLKNYDYSLNGYYFVTICAKDRENLFGEYKNTKNVGAGFPCPNNDINNNSINNGRGNRAPTLGQMIAYFKYQSTKQINLLDNSPTL